MTPETVSLRHRRTRKQRSSSEERFRSIVELQTEFIVRWTPDGRRTFVNEAYCRYFNLSRQKAVGTSFFSLIFEPDREKVREKIASLNPERPVGVDEHRAYRPDGTLAWQQWTERAIFDSKGKMIEIQSVGQDITLRKHAEEALRQSRKQFQDLVERINDWVWEVDENAVYTYASPKIFDLLGYRPEEVVGTTPFDLMPESESSRVAEIFAGIVERRQPFHALENTNRHRDGRLVVLETSGVPFFDDNGSLLGYRGVDRDITARKNAEEALRASDRMKTEFVTTVAHEFQTPLTSIQGFSELLLTREDLSPGERTEFLSYIHENSAELSRIVTDLLDIARIEQGHGLSLRLTPCTVREMFDKVTPFLKARATTHRLEVTLTAEDTVLNIDRGKMGQVLENLISNALKYSPEGSLVHIRGAPIPEGYLIAVADRGIGMTPEQVARIFDKFYRVDTSHAAVKGVGLGMSIVKHIVDVHGGRIWVESALGEGTTASFTLPAADGKINQPLPGGSGGAPQA
jgi:PAS domain S-box-containing protein